MVDQVEIPHSVVAGKEPLPSEISIAGLAVNLKDGILYTKGYDGTIIRLTGIKPKSTQLPAPATDLNSAIQLVNAIRTLLIDCGIGS